MQQLMLWSTARLVRPTVVESTLPDFDEGRPATLASWLAERLGRPVHATLTHNRRCMLSYRERRGTLRVRLHRCFAHADHHVWDAVVSYLATGSGQAQKVLDLFIATQREPAGPSARPVRARGRFHDLAHILQQLNQEHFHGACSARIGWGRPGSRRYRRTIQLGVYVADENLIRIHPCLDQSFVPQQYVAWVVFHEMLHEVFGIGRGTGTHRVLHPREFGVVETTFPGYEQCKEWENENLHRLLRYGGTRA